MKNLLDRLPKFDITRLDPLKQKMRHMMGDFDVREKAGAIVAVILAWLGLNLAFAFFVNLPRANEVLALNEEVQRLNREIGTKAKDIDRLRPQHTRVLEGNSSLEIFYDEILSTKRERLISFQREIRQIAEQFNINMDAIAYPREVMSNRVVKLGAAMPLSGSYENLRAFIKTVEESDNFIVIESIQLANAKEGGVILSLTIVLSTHFVDPEAPDMNTGPQQARRS